MRRIVCVMIAVLLAVTGAGMPQVQAEQLPVVEFASLSKTVIENQSFVIPIQTKWSQKKDNLRVNLRLSDGVLDIVNTRFTTATNEMKELGDNGQVYAIDDGYSTDSPKPVATTRSFYVRKGVFSTNLMVGGCYDGATRAHKAIELVIMPSTDGSYVVGSKSRMRIVLTDVDALRPITRGNQSAAAWVKANLNYLRAKYPHKKYWNHMIGTQDDDECVTTRPCSTHNGDTIRTASWPSLDLTIESGATICMHNWKYPSTQCMGYALRVATDVFGSNPMVGGWKVYKTVNAAGGIKVGDYIRAANHSMFVVGVSGKRVSVTDCNAGGKGKECVILWHNYTVSGSSVGGMRIKEIRRCR